MNILLITDDFYPNFGGVANVLWNLYKFFQNKEHKLLIFNPYSKFENVYKEVIIKNYVLKDLACFLREREFYYYVIYSFWKVIKDKNTPFSHRLKILMFLIFKPKILMKVIKNVSNLIPYLKKLNFDIIVGGNSGWIFSLVYILSRFFNKKLISIAYGNDFLIRNPLSLKTYYFRNTDKIIVINNQMKQIIKKMHRLNEHQLEIIFVGLNLKEFDVKTSKKELRREFNIPEKQFVLLSVGRHVPRKRFDLVIKAVSVIKKLKPSLNIKYILIGAGQKTLYLKNLTKQLNLESHIEFLGSCDLEKRNKFYKLSDIFLMPVETKKDNIEGFGIVFLEANYYNVPVIGTATGGIVEAIIDGETGLLIKPNDLNDLVEKILYLYENENIRKKMGEKGYRRVIKDFSWDDLVHQYIKVFSDVLG
ncbi:hypothetical protein LCGC14_1341790 [marine sediment metagenome]|uniref:Glycosyl transferase family 1 domain-containing protein n=1 Tax=marine sediment metagenome TaxID=412755 RepID=A0A0F9MUC2_9ZZZZ|nr:glycosyltransferase family 1 protein [bacterium]